MDEDLHAAAFHVLIRLIFLFAIGSFSDLIT